MNHSNDHPSPFQSLVNIMFRLRSEDGCAWDLEQTPKSLQPYILEEAYELLEALDDGDPEHIKEELGDLLLQVVFQAQIFSEHQLFDIDDVCQSIADKMHRRHPHVFAQHSVSDISDIEKNWDIIKTREKIDKGHSPQLLTGIPTQLPALHRAQKIITRLRCHGYGPERIIKEIDAKNLECDNQQQQLERSFATEFFHLVCKAERSGVHAEESLRKYLGCLEATFIQQHLQPDKIDSGRDKGPSLSD